MRSDRHRQEPRRCVQGSATDDDEQVCTNWWNLPDRIERVEGDPPRGPTSEDALVGCGDLLPSRTRRAARSRTRARSRRRLRARLAWRRRRGKTQPDGASSSRRLPRGRQGARQDPVAERPRRVSARRRRRGGDVQTGAVRRRGLRRRRSFARRGAESARTKSARTRRTTTRRRVTARGCARWWTCTSRL